MNEEWRSIRGYKGYYEVSNLGRLRSLNRTYIDSMGRKYILSGRVLKLGVKKHGYVQTELRKNGKIKPKYVHRLVAQAFIPNPDNKPCVNHKNGNREDNRVENLEWCTESENALHALNYGLSKARGSTAYNATLTEEDVKEICLKLDLKECRQSEIALKFGLTVATVNQIYRGLRWNWLTNRKGSIPKVNKKGANNPAARSVINCRGEIFKTLKEAALKYKINNPSSISKVCRGKVKHSGKYEDGTPIKWYYIN